MEYLLRPIGVIHTPFTEKTATPIQAARSDTRGWVEVAAEYADGLCGVEDFSHLYLIYAFHASQGYQLQVEPFLDDRLHGLFATRFPYRPNPIGLSVVRLVQRAGCRLDFEGADMLDGTPLLDIKPYIPEFDHFEVTQTGWYANRAKD
ncbi:MAG TPA: tRNA (N6-threonylcarbamoyladenosine(37)-N6)-methyltransferase TrmO [Anaerolineaceae bacterium]|jgi:tRNA-Thr(GGU) m(6)t(6)A37 methyltransferase TsaA|nr:tRNA (N6-threonylcarbamoyladenosine(37)-N6)-methyltransferase TrmO [Anaerolineaceae bacterium]